MSDGIPQPLDDAAKARLQADYERVKRALDDPNSLYAAMSPHERERAEKEAAAILIRAGVNPSPQPVTPRDLAMQQHAKVYDQPLPAGIVETVNAQCASVAKLHPDDIAKRAGELRRELGPAVYDEMLRDAAAVAPAGVTVKAIGADRYSLRTLGAQGRFQRIGAATAPR